MLLWLIAGFLLGVAAIFLYQHPNIKLAWYDWLMIVFALAFYILAIVNFNGSMAELEPRAANFLLVSFGIPGLILTAIVAVRVWRSFPASPSAETTTEAAA